MENNFIYLDNESTTPLSENVLNIKKKKNATIIPI